MSKLNKIAPLLAVIVLVFGSQFASANSVYIPNADGALPVIPAGTDWATPAANWSGYIAYTNVFKAGGDPTAGTPDRFPLGLPAGQTQVLNSQNYPGNNAMYQFLTTNWIGGQQYTLSAYEGYDATGDANFQVNAGGMHSTLRCGG